MLYSIYPIYQWMYLYSKMSMRRHLLLHRRYHVAEKRYAKDCDPAVYEKVLELRERRLDLEDITLKYF